MAYESLIEGDELIQGASSDINMFSTPMATDLSLGGWRGAYSVSTKIGEAPIFQRALPLNDGTEGETPNMYFVFQMLPAETASLAPGTYYVAVEIENPDIDYNGEIAQYKLKIKPQGVTQV